MEPDDKSQKDRAPDAPDSTPTPRMDAGELFARALNTVQPSPGANVWTPPPLEELARLLPQYRIEALLGHGGMGAVYKGWQPTLDRAVAIKLLPAEIAADEEFVARFEREARTLAKLQHPGIVAVYDFGRTAAGHLYFVMEYVDGTDLHKMLRAQPLAPAQALEAICQICDALHHAHQHGVIHRDIKPANILFTKEGRAKLADFGIARPASEGDDSGRLTLSNMVMGTPAYMAPEQQRGHTDLRADIYALGVMLYEMLTGERPQGIFEMPSRKVAVDARIDAVVTKALQQEPDRRYQQVSEMQTDVDRIRTTPLRNTGFQPVRPAGFQPAQDGPGRQDARRPHRMEGRVPLAAALALLLGIIAFLIWKMEHPSATTTATAEQTATFTSAPTPASAKPSPTPQPTPTLVIASTATPPPKIEPTPLAPTPTPTPTPMPATVVVKSATVPVAPPPAATPAPAPSLLPSFSQQIPNITAWVLAPLDETVPAGIRQNLTFLREDLADEAKRKPAASLAAYQAGTQLCTTLLAILDERNQAQVRAGFRGVEANARTGITSQALEARRNYMMSWPQYAREGAQRAELKSQAINNAQVMKERPKVEWSQRTTQLSKILDNLYAQFRAALRQSPAAK